ncbi:NUDIX hydrolase [Intrasporangium chromatireducens Q5-1]|uniref:NUDIX hydrolase n=1 Tax=Intrasporangium chromatireducens Q5-1 TaxID=584657 RepID=W9GV35_9MICO|nr:NUDIX hydrolase [Intrasporangium chromatireducens Q5-1]
MSSIRNGNCIAATGPCGCNSAPPKLTTVGCLPPGGAERQRTESAPSAISPDGEPLAVLAHLLRVCRDHAECLSGGWVEQDLPTATLTRLAHAKRLIALNAGRGRLGQLACEAIADAVAHGRRLDGIRCAYLLAGEVDRVLGHTFEESFRRRAPYEPAVGDPVPIESPDIRQLIDMPASTPPWRLVQRVDQTRRVRLAGAWAAQYRVIYEVPSMDGPLLTPDTIVASCQPNLELAELSVPHDRQQQAFPVGPLDPVLQRHTIDEQIRWAVDAGASIVVLPELSVTAELSHHLHQWVQRDDGPKILVAGTFHERHVAERGGTPRQTNTGMVWAKGVGHPLVHRKHTPARAPVLEALDVEARPTLRIWVLPGGWRLTLAICRDLLNPQAVHALSEAVVNVVLVPAMSDSLRPFVASAAVLVGLSQAFVIVANNPADWGEGLARPADAALFGHPGLGQLTRLVASNAEPGVTLMSIRSASIRRLTAQGPSPGRLAAPSEDAPSWLGGLTSLTERGAGRGQPRRPGPWHQAAVLVVVRGGGPSRASVLLTRRADDLAQYPDVMSFPGGAVDEGDVDPIAAALREAAEEVGLEPGSVRVLGVLPDYALAGSAFIVTPVLAWSTQPRFTQGVNTAEVAEVGWHDVGVPLPEGDGHARAGRMTQAILDQLAGALARQPASV